MWITFEWILIFVFVLGFKFSFEKFIEQSNKEKCVYSVGSFLFLFCLSLKKSLNRKGIKIEPGGGENLYSLNRIGNLSGVLEKIGLCRTVRLHACIASDSKLANNFILPTVGAGNFIRQAQALPPNPISSVFRIKIYFQFPCIHNPSIAAQTTKHSFDFLEERNGSGIFNKPLGEYNGYIFLIRFLYRLHLQGHLKSAAIYNNLSSKHEEIIRITPENILELTQGLKRY